MTKDAIKLGMQNAARQLGVQQLKISEFREITGIPQSQVMKHYDSWSEACKDAGVGCVKSVDKLVHKKAMSAEMCINEMKQVAEILGKRQLSSKEFTRNAKFTAKPVIQRFGTWQQALAEAGLEPCEKAVLDTPLSIDECVLELQRVAKLLATDTLRRADLDGHSSYSAHRIARACGGFLKALSLAGLQPTPDFNPRIPIETLADPFLKVVVELQRIPTLVQLSRRSGHATATLSKNRGGYSAFKHAVIGFLLSSNSKFPKGILEILRNELTRLNEQTPQGNAPVIIGNEHRQGRTLNFRGFAYAPTCEHDVVQMFGAVANDLGFEIIGNRSAFPDCKARRRQETEREHFIDCLIEYEFSSRDFKKHKHDPKGCNLIVCWEHNWPECPVEVLKLKTAIRDL